ncbi:MAG: hypothetical protein NZ556_02830 [Fimbriimonadales bacterium]|nr:hypothetical protein [Fimbriimonadales bacterium]
MWKQWGRYAAITAALTVVVSGLYAQSNALEVEWRRFPNYANSPTFSPDGSLFATIADGVVYVYQMPGWTPKFSFRASSASARVCRFSPDGRYLATLSDDGIARLWEVQSWTLQRTFSVAPDHGRGLEFDRSGRRIAVMGYRVRVWDVDTGALLFERVNIGNGRFAFSPNGRYLAMEGESSTRVLQVFDIDANAPVANFTPEGGLQLEAIAFSPDGSLLAFTSRNRTYLIRTDTWQVRTSFVDWNQSSGYRALAFSPDSQLLYAAGGLGFENNQNVRPLRIWRVSDTRLLGSAYLQYSPADSLAVSPDGTWVVIGRLSPIEVYHTPTSTLQVIGEFMDPAYDMAIAPSGVWYATADSLRWATRRDARTGARIYRTAEGGHIQTAISVAISPDETIIATGGQDSRIVLWNAATGAVERVITGSSGAVVCVAFLGDGSTLLSVGADGFIRLWSVNTGSQIRAIALGVQAQAARLSADKQWLAIGGQDRRVRLFRVSDLTQVAQSALLDAVPNSLAVSPNGQRIAVGLNGGALLALDAPSMTVRYTGNFNAKTLCLAFAPDGRHLAISANRLNRLVILNTDTGSVAFETTREVANGITAMAFTATGRSLIFARGDTAQMRVRNPVYRAGDVNADGCVNDADLLTLLAAFGATGAELPADVNDDGMVDDADLLEVLFNFGSGC